MVRRRRREPSRQVGKRCREGRCHWTTSAWRHEWAQASDGMMFQPPLLVSLSTNSGAMDTSIFCEICQKWRPGHQWLLAGGLVACEACFPLLQTQIEESEQRLATQHPPLQHHLAAPEEDTSAIRTSEPAITVTSVSSKASPRLCENCRQAQSGCYGLMLEGTRRLLCEICATSSNGEVLALKQSPNCSTPSDARLIGIGLHNRPNNVMADAQTN